MTVLYFFLYIFSVIEPTSITYFNDTDEVSKRGSLKSSRSLAVGKTPETKKNGFQSTDQSTMWCYDQLQCQRFGFHTENCRFDKKHNLKLFVTPINLPDHYSLSPIWCLFSIFLPFFNRDHDPFVSGGNVLHTHLIWK